MISARLGVSKSTVSRALKGHRSISEKTRAAVMAIARELGYQPNAIARGLVTRRSGIIGFVIAETENPFFEEQLEKLTKHVSRREMQVLLLQVATNGDLADVIPSMLQYRLDGCIILASVPVSKEAVATCTRYGVPVVLLNRTMPETKASSVLCNSFAGSQRIAEFLIAGGHSRIAFIAGRQNSIIAHDREAGFRAGLAAAGREIYAREEGGFTFAGGYQATKRLLSLTPRPDAIFASSDIMALAALDAIREAGLRVPDDISVIGFDGIRASAWPAYRLTTIAQPADILFERSIDLLTARIEDPNRPPEAIYVHGNMLIRGSARIPPGYELLAEHLDRPSSAENATAQKPPDDPMKHDAGERRA
ncbi:MAG TPA: LacI family DNA-binding transcriptional regulator [Alphaproteobacteria bacterium]